MVDLTKTNPRNKVFNFNEYEIPNLAETKNNILNPVYPKDKLLTSIYLKLDAVIFYFEYSLGALQSFEYFLRLEQTEEFRKGNLLPDAILCSNAIASYSYMYASIKMLKKALCGFENEAIVKRTLEFDECYKYISQIRHRVAAHPEEDDTKESRRNYIMSKRSSISYYDHNQSGSIKIRQIFIPDANKNVTPNPQIYELYPRKHFNEFKIYLDDIGQLLKKKIISYCKKYKIQSNENILK